MSHESLVNPLFLIIFFAYKKNYKKQHSQMFLKHFLNIIVSTVVYSCVPILQTNPAEAYKHALLLTYCYPGEKERK